MAPLALGRKVLCAPPPLLTAVRLSEAGYYSMVLSWAGPPERSITVRLRAAAANLRDAQAEAADQLLSFDATTLAWLNEHAQPTAAGVPELTASARRPVEREAPHPASNPERAADIPQPRRATRGGVASARPSDRRQSHRTEG